MNYKNKSGDNFDDDIVFERKYPW